MDPVRDDARPPTYEPRAEAPASGLTLVARSARMRECMALALRAATGDIPVLLTGESGTGKELLARAIHTWSLRAARPFVALNCAALPEGLLESELFGHRRGSFTGATADKTGLFETAHRGTLLLDEVADLPMPLQAKLLRILEDGRVRRLGDVQPTIADVRVVSSTNADLEDRVRAGTFRRDLYYRLAAFQIRLPALRERPDDVEVIARHFVSREAGRLGRPVPALTTEALAVLRAHTWPGNVRELRNVVLRALVTTEGHVLCSDDFDLSPGGDASPAWELPHDGIDLPALVRRLVATAIERERGDVAAAARLLGMSRRALRSRVLEYGLANDPRARRGAGITSGGRP